MTTLAVRRVHLPFWPVAAVAVAAWLVAWFANLPLANWAAYDLLGLERGSHLGDAVAFFLLDVPKVLLLLLGIVTVVSFLRSYFPPERVRAALAGRGTLAGTVAAAGFGVVTPFCSCSAVPLFIGFVEAGIPMGVTFAFLISSPMVNEVALVLLWGLFGPGVALALHGAPGCRSRSSAGSSSAGSASSAGSSRGCSRSGPAAERHRSTSAAASSSGCGTVGRTRGTSSARSCSTSSSGSGSARSSTASCRPISWPRSAGARTRSRCRIVVLLAIPLYSNAAGTIPIVEALLGKGLPLGTTLAFMMAIVAISLPEFVILRRVIRPRLIALFATVVVVGILAVGFLFNALGL